MDENIYLGMKTALEGQAARSEIHLDALVDRLIRSMDRDQFELRVGIYLCFAALCVIAWRVW